MESILRSSTIKRLILLFLILHQEVLPQDVPSDKKPEAPAVATLSETNLSAEAFEAAITHLATRTDLKAELQTSLQTSYKEGLSRVKEMEGLLLQKKSHETTIASAPKELETLKN